jgi:hypothetical protein
MRSDVRIEMFDQLTDLGNGAAALLKVSVG